MSVLPIAGYLNDGGRTEGEMKVAFEDLRGVIAELLGGGAETELTISGGSVTPTTGVHRIDTEADAASDDLDHIDYANHPDGRLLLIHPENSARDVTVRHGQGGNGQILLIGSANLILSTTEHYLLLRRSGTTWVEISRFLPPDQTLATSGYIRFPFGLILQWGFVQTDAVGDSTWTFPIPFSTAVYHVSGNDVLGDTARLVTFGTPGLSSVTAFITGAGTGVSSTAQVFAIGK